jgi:hypothetical protein
MGGGEDNFVNKQLIDMKRISKLLLTLCLLVVVGEVWGQAATLTAEEIASLKKLAEYNTRWNSFLNVWAILGPILAAVVTWLGLRKKAEDWAEKEITKKASEKFGVDWGTVKILVDNEKRRQAVRAKRIAVINHDAGKRDELMSVLVKAGFAEKNIHFYKWTEIGSFNDNNHDLILLDNFDGLITDDNLKKQIEAKIHKFKIVVYSAVDVSFFSKYDKIKVKITKNPAYIADNIEQLVL